MAKNKPITVEGLHPEITYPSKHPTVTSSSTHNHYTYHSLSFSLSSSLDRSGPPSQASLLFQDGATPQLLSPLPEEPFL